MARSKIYAYEAQAAKGSEEAAQLKQAEASDTANLRQSQQRERERAEQMVRDLAKASRDLAAETERASKASEEVARIKQARERDVAQLRNLLQRERERATGLERDFASARHDGGAPVAKAPPAGGSILPEQGNIGAARIVLERAVGMGSAQASFALAETYDPLILPNLGTYGTQGDLAKARTLYARVEAGGSKEVAQSCAAMFQVSNRGSKAPIRMLNV